MVNNNNGKAIRVADKDDHDNDSTYGSYTPSPNRTASPRSSHSSGDLTTQHEGEASRHPPRAPPFSSTTPKPRGDANVTWLSLPRKDQLLILMLARLAEPLAQTSLQAYMFFMLKSFDNTLTDSEIASQAGLLTASFTVAQCMTAVWWGRVADKEWMGRKNVLVIGLTGTFVSTLGFGFSRSFWSAMAFRFLGGALNGNVGVMRTMISEIIKEKKYQPKAFLVLPVTFNVGVLIGPVLGGWLQNPVELYPSIFGPGSAIGGLNGVQWMKDFPYALPNLLMAVIFIMSILLVLGGLEETHIDRRHRPDRAVQFTRWIGRLIRRPFTRRHSQDYVALDSAAIPSDDVELSATTKPKHLSSTPLPSNRPRRAKLPYRRIFTPNVCLTLLAHALLGMHVSAFNSLWFIFLSTPRSDSISPSSSSSTYSQSPSFLFFTGGLGFSPQTIGFAISIIGVLGLFMQFGVYSRVVSRLGVLTTFRVALLLTFPFVYLLAPFIVLIPTPSASTSAAPPSALARGTDIGAGAGPPLWIAITCLLFLQVLGRTFVLPIAQILVNNCTPHPSVLGAVHGIAQSVASGARTIGPVAWGYMYGWGLRKGVVGFAWWLLAVEAGVGAVASWGIYEGSGHEILLDGEVEEGEENAV